MNSNKHQNAPNPTETKIDNIENFDNCVHENKDAKLKPYFEIARSIAFKIHRCKIDYDGLRYIFKLVRERCKLEPKKDDKRILDLPTDEEMTWFYKAIRNPIHQLLFELLDGSGLRISELSRLQPSHIDFQTNIITVHQGKGKKDRKTLIGNRLKEKLKLYIEGKDLRYLFESVRGTKYSTRRLEQICDEYRKKSGIEKRLTPHTFRHRYFTNLAYANISKEKRAMLAGHVNDKTQDIYTKLTLEGLREEVIAALDKVGGK